MLQILIGWIFILVVFISGLFIFNLPVQKFSEPPKLELPAVVQEIKPPALALPKPEERKPDQTQSLKEKAELEKIASEILKLRRSLEELAKPPPEAASPKPPLRSEEVYAKAEKALVNVFCDDSEKGTYILGSGAVIHPAGYVITNGHLAEHFLRDRVQCVLRRGSPAAYFAKARVVYLPDQTELIGDTEIPLKDIAILKITESANALPLPETFEYFEFAPAYQVSENEVLYSLSFPTEFLGADIIVRNTTILFSLGTVSTLLTLDDDYSNSEGAYLKGEISAQHGSSGGIFLETGRGRIVGLFVGLTEGATTSERKQFIFLSPYIDRIFKADKGAGVTDFLNSNP